MRQTLITKCIIKITNSILSTQKQTHTYHYRKCEIEWHTHAQAQISNKNGNKPFLFLFPVSVSILLYKWFNAVHDFYRYLSFTANVNSMNCEIIIDICVKWNVCTGQKMQTHGYAHTHTHMQLNIKKQSVFTYVYIDDTLHNY